MRLLLWALVGIASLRGSTALRLPGALPRRRLVAGAPAALALALGPRAARAAEDRAALKRRALDVLAAIEPLPALVDENKWDGCLRRRFFFLRRVGRARVGSGPCSRRRR